MTVDESPLDVVRAFTERVDAHDVDGAAALLADDVNSVTPRGTARGKDAFRAYMARQSYGVTAIVESRRWFTRGDAVVVSARQHYEYVDTGEAAGPPEDRAELFHVRDGLIVHFQPFGDVEEAIGAGGLSEADEVRPLR